MGTNKCGATLVPIADDGFQGVGVCVCGKLSANAHRVLCCGCASPVLCLAGWPEARLRKVERRGDPVAETGIHKLDVLFREAEIALRDLKTTLRSAQ